MPEGTRPDERLDSEVTVVAIMTAARGKHEELAAELAALVGPTRTEPGCLQYDLSVEIEAPERFIFTERWRSERDLARHRTEAHLLAFRERATELLAGPLEVIVARPTTH
jgi:quinol monooxygenase YgiN